MLESYLREKLTRKDILLMTHIVLGYPSFEDCFAVVETMVKAGVDLMELQIPFSEPIADGPVILRANQRVLERGVTVQACLDFAREVAQTFDIPFLVMSYYNVVFRYGVDEFASRLIRSGMRGAIIPDLPPEEGQNYLTVMGKNGLDPILIFSPTTSDSRMNYIASLSHGFIYCVSHKGVTGTNTAFSEELAVYLARCRAASQLPLALGFGIGEKGHVDWLKGKADIAVIGTQTLRVLENGGIDSVGHFISGLL